MGYSEEVGRKHEKHLTTPRLEVTQLSGFVFVQNFFEYWPHEKNDSIQHNVHLGKCA